MKNRFAAMVALGLAVLSGPGWAVDYFVWKGTEADSVRDYTKYDVADEAGKGSGTAATEALPDGSVVFVPQNGTFHAVDADFTFLNTLAGLRPMVGSSTIVFEIESDQHYDGYVYGFGTGTPVTAKVYKKGIGTLTLNYADKVDGKNYYGYYAAWHVEQGVLSILPDIASTDATRYYYRMTIAEGAEVKMPYGKGTTYLKNGLCGGGTISHEAVSGANARLQICGSCTTPFSGKITGDLHVRAYGTCVLTGTESDFTNGAFEFYGGDISAVDFGETSSVPSSLGGIGKPFTVTSEGMFLTSLLDETTAPKTCEREFRNWSTTGGTTQFSGGPYGDFTFQGTIRMYAKDSAACRLVLTGDHTHPCTFKPGRVDTAAAYESYYTLVKRGKGTWAVTPGTTAMGRMSVICGVLVEDGLVQFGYLRSKGVKTAYTSFGFMTNSYPYVFTGYAYSGKNVDRTAPGVDYQFRLGKADDLTQNGMMEYIGKEDVSCTDRGFAIAGNGGFKNDTAYKFCLAGLKSIPLPEGGDAPTLNVLTLDTGSAAESRLDDVTEQAGAIRILKKGAGEWKLGGRQLFTGGATVEGGTLTVEQPADGEVLPDGFSYVKVATNATLKVDGGEPIATTNLVVDASGAGTFDNVAFAETGLLQFENVDLTARSTRIPVGFASVATRANLHQWDVTVNGSPLPSKFALMQTDEGFEITKKGMVLLVR